MINDAANDRPENRADEPETPTETQVEREGFSLARAMRSPRTWISFALAIAIIGFVFRGFNIDIAKTWAYMRGADPALMLGGLGVFYLTFPMRAYRWRMLLRNADVPIMVGQQPAAAGTFPAKPGKRTYYSWASMWALMEYIFLSWFANCVVPAKLGDAYRGYLLKRNGQVSFSATLGTIFAERLLDMLGLFTLLVLSGWFVFGTHLPPATNGIFVSGLVLVAIILVGLAGMRWFSPYLRRLMPQRLLGIYSTFEDAALRSFQPRFLPALTLLTGAVWLLEGLRLFFVIEALGPQGLHLSLPVIIFVALASSLLTAIPLTPAGLGVVEGAITAVLLALPVAAGSQPVSRDLALAVTFLDRAINFWSIVVIGLLLYLFSKRK